MILVGKAAATRLRDLCQQYQAWKLNCEGAEKPSWTASALCRKMFRSIERAAGLPIGIRFFDAARSIRWRKGTTRLTTATSSTAATAPSFPVSYDLVTGLGSPVAISSCRSRLSE